MRSFIYIQSSGIQTIIETEDTGSISPALTLLYDTKRDNGPITQQMRDNLGGISRNPDGSLSFDASAAATQQAAELDKETKNAARDTRAETARTSLFTDLPSTTTTLPELKAIVQDMFDALKMGE